MGSTVIKKEAKNRYWKKKRNIHFLNIIAYIIDSQTTTMHQIHQECAGLKPKFLGNQHWLSKLGFQGKRPGNLYI